jgi:DNA helicase IV
MSQHHPDIPAEQAHVDHAYRCLERSKDDAWRIRSLTEASTGGTFQARFERNAFDEQLVQRLTELDLGDAALVFGRIDRDGEAGAGSVETFYIGRLAVADEAREPVVVDWRAPVAEPFYRATGRDPMGLVRRRHFAVDGPRVLGIEDELFGAGHLGVGHDEGLNGDATAVTQAGTGLRGYGTLLSALAKGRTGQLGDIVATIQAEQDEIIRSPHKGVLVVQGGPGTGKTVVALHRAAYLLYTHRFPLEDQGVLVVGPNRVFLRYIEQVLPSLGEAGVQLAVLSDLVHGHSVGASEPVEVARLKGGARMTAFIVNAVRDRGRPLREPVAIPFGGAVLRLSVEQSSRIVAAARRRYRRHNAARRFVETEVVAALANSLRKPDTDLEGLREQLREVGAFRELMERMWPVLAPAELLHDLFGSPALLRSAARGVLDDGEHELLRRPRSSSSGEVQWTVADVALLDEALEVLGPRPRRSGRIHDDDEIRKYGHIVVDEVQDLSPMHLRMLARRSISGAMTVVGDLAQATGPLAPRTWQDVLAHLPDRRPSVVTDLTVGYRIPAEIMEVAARVLRVAAPDLEPPTSVRSGAQPPGFRPVARPSELLGAVVDEVRRLEQEVGGGSVAVVCADPAAPAVSEALRAAGLDHGTTSIEQRLSVVPASVVKGLELDGVVVVEPADIAGDDLDGQRALYVALTRATKVLSVVHAAPLPASMSGREVGIAS